MASRILSPEYETFQRNFDFITTSFYKQPSPVLEKFVEESFTRGLISEDDLCRCLLEKRYGHNLFQILLERINLNSSDY